MIEWSNCRSPVSDFQVMCSLISGLIRNLIYYPRIVAIDAVQDIYTLEIFKPIVSKKIDKTIFKYIPKGFAVEINKLDEQSR